MSEPIYVISDIHGQIDELNQSLSRIHQDGGEDAKIVFLGDYIDRGPDSHGVIERLIQGKEEGRDWTFIKGNHDEEFQSFLLDDAGPYFMNIQNLDQHYHWIMNLGGAPTLRSYDLDIHNRTVLKVQKDAKEKIPSTHIKFLNELKLSHESDDKFFVHAGIRPGIPFADQKGEDLIWIREAFLNSPMIHPKLIIHGHTPIDQPTHYGNRVNLDAGNGWGNPGTAAVFEGEDVWILTKDGRQPILKILKHSPSPS